MGDALKAEPARPFLVQARQQGADLRRVVRVVLIDPDGGGVQHRLTAPDAGKAGERVGLNPRAEMLRHRQRRTGIDRVEFAVGLNRGLLEGKMSAQGQRKPRRFVIQQPALVFPGPPDGMDWRAEPAAGRDPD